jgi:hypothetical protein
MEIEWKEHKFLPGARQAIVEFENGYSGSVVTGSSYFYSKYEVAVFDSNGLLDYTTPVTDDVVPCATWEKVLEVLEQIKALPKPEVVG